MLIKSPYANASFSQFGSGVVAGYFNRDDFDDLAISGTLTTSGDPTRLRVLLRVEGVLGSGSEALVPASIQMPEHHAVMIAGDFDGDGRDEIAVGVDGAPGAGAVYVMNRASNGTWSVQSEIRVGGPCLGTAQANASLSASLAAGDFNSDGYADLAIGMDGQIVSGAINAGVVMVPHGSSSGIAARGAQLFNRTSGRLKFTPRQDDRFADSLAAGDFDSGGHDALAIGIPDALCPDDSKSAGAVVVLTGSTGGIVISDDGQFGIVLATGRLADDGVVIFCAGDSLVIVAPNATVDGFDGAGAVWLVAGELEDELDLGGISAILPRPPLQLDLAGIRPIRRCPCSQRLQRRRSRAADLPVPGTDVCRGLRVSGAAMCRRPFPRIRRIRPEAAQEQARPTAHVEHCAVSAGEGPCPAT